MKLVSIALSDIRRFTDPVTIRAIGPGLNLLSAPNEEGKSTLFDALQAVFFQPYRTKTKEIKALRPHAGGAPAVTVELDLPDGRYRIAKRWLQRESATVHRDGQLLAQADAAETFIAGLVRSEGDAGPAGLLWVRQGLTRLDDDSGSPRDREGALSARRNLVTSVAGEVESVTGGRRMDRVLARTRAELARYLTPTARALRGGPLATAETELDDLRQSLTQLQETAARLDQALTRRREVARLLADLTDPEAAASRETRLDEARRRFEAAQGHAEKLSVAATARRSAELESAAVQARLDDLAGLVAAEAAAAQKAAEAGAAAAAATTERSAAEAVLAPLATDLAAARAARQAAETRHRAALAAQAARAAAGRRADLETRLAALRDKLARRGGLARQAGLGPDAAAMARLAGLAQEADIQRALSLRSAPKLVFHHDGPGRVTLAGTAVPDGAPIVVPGPMRFDLPGLGRLEVTPGEGRDDSARDRAEAALAAALAELGLADLPAARQAAAVRDEARAALRDLDREIAALAPEGVASLEAALAALPGPVADAGDLPAPDEAEAEVARQAARQDQLDSRHDLARRQAEHLRGLETRAAVLAETAKSAQDEAQARLARLGDATRLRHDLTGALALAQAHLAEAAERHAALAADAPDLAAARAQLDRATSVSRGAEDDIRRLGQERAGLDSEIALRSGEGILEDLADTRSRLAAAEERLDRLRFEVAVLQELAAALGAARDEARDRYLEPVMAELRPLLRVLWPDAELRFDGESLLPTALLRNGREEDIAVLSGGTQEQVALLVRLAFARLLARRGRHAPLILDDALVFTDDDRIEKLFDALHAQATDQQIIVLTCRQRAFRDLGGNRLMLERAAPEA